MRRTSALFDFAQRHRVGVGINSTADAESARRFDQLAE